MQMPGGVGSVTVGVAGLMRRQVEQAAAASEQMTEAFADLKQLMSLAEDMVTLADKFRRHAASAAPKEGKEEDSAQVEQELMSIGLANPVSKEEAGSQYHTALARELCDFIQPALAKAGGVMSLSEVYCRYNRARTTSLVSPEDLKRAAKAMARLGLPVQAHKFDSGVYVLKSSQLGDEAVCRSILEIVQGPGLGPSLSVLDVSTRLGVSTSLAQHYLQLAEQRLMVCRDEGVQGLRYYKNFFATVTY